MALSMYQAAVPGILRMLHSLSAILDKAQTMVSARKWEDAKLLDARLFPDMFPLARQIQSVSDNAKGIIGRLSGSEAPSMPDTETTIADLKARLTKTAEFINSIHPSKFDGAETRTVSLPVGGGNKIELAGPDYLFLQGLPNFYFHATTAYDILRHCGLEVGKRDYLGAR